MEFDTTKPVPETQPWSERFWAGTREGKLLIQVCKECKSRIFYPRKHCPECWSGSLDWMQASGKATVFTFSTAYAMVEPKFMDELPYTIAYVDLEEGVRMMTRIVGCAPEEVPGGMVRLARPRRIGIGTLPPSAAVAIGTGTSE